MLMIDVVFEGDDEKAEQMKRAEMEKENLESKTIPLEPIGTR